MNRHSSNNYESKLFRRDLEEIVEERCKPDTQDTNNRSSTAQRGKIRVED